MVWQRPLENIIIVAGPTGSGKTAHAIKLAQELNSEIISVDSVQCFKYFNIGSAKPTKEELDLVKHHQIDCYEPNIQITAAEYARDACVAIDHLLSLGKTPILCGGSNLYLKAILYGLADLPKADLELRDKLEKFSNEDLFQELKRLDSPSSLKINSNDRIRMIRAIESGSSGVLFSEKTNSHNFTNIKYDPIIHLLDMPREELYAKINLRTEKMIADGLIQEAKEIFEKFGDVAPLKTIGYLQAKQFFNNEISEQDLIPLIAQATRRYAKQQVTFWRNEPKKRGWKVINN